MTLSNYSIACGQMCILHDVVLVVVSPSIA